jgi:hypothetical protein
MFRPIPINVFPNIKKSVTVCKAIITVQSIVLFESITLSVSLIDTNDTTVEVRVYTISGNDYAGWGVDDSYIVNWVKAKLQDEGQYQNN